MSPKRLAKLQTHEEGVWEGGGVVGAAWGRLLGDVGKMCCCWGGVKWSWKKGRKKRSKLVCRKLQEEVGWMFEGSLGAWVTWENVQVLE